MDKTMVFIDMDGVLSNFEGSKHFKPTDKVMRKPPRGFEEGFFESLPVIPGARWAIRTLLKNENLDVRILTKPVHRSYLCYSEKVSWIAKHFPELLEKITITHDKIMLAAPGRILIDDYAQDWQEGWIKAGGEFIHFETHRAEEHWTEICEYLSPMCFNIKPNLTLIKS
jgi:5'(3')-deoxyribonucleotidase